MGKFCTACGSRIEEGEAFCAECGTPVKRKQDIKPVVRKIEQPETSSIVPVVRGKSSALIGIAVVAVIFCIIIGIFISAVSNNGGSKKDKTSTKPYEIPLKTYFKALEKGDWNKYSSVFTDGLINTIERNIGNLGSDDSYDYMQNMLETNKKQFGNNFKISYEINGTEKINEDMLRSMEKSYLYNNLEEITISEAYKINVIFSVKGDKADDSYEQIFTVAKIKSKWYIMKSYSVSNIPFDSAITFS